MTPLPDTEPNFLADWLERKLGYWSLFVRLAAQELVNLGRDVSVETVQRA